jgi:predicted nucleotidyltransferase
MRAENVPTMISLIDEHRAELVEICRRFGVQSLELFGSAADDTFDPQRSDLDFLVLFAPCAPAQRYDRYFGVLEALQAVFDRPVDLVEADALRNPFFIRGVQRTRRLLYAA